jgi:Uma2 family endonuclease
MLVTSELLTRDRCVLGRNAETVVPAEDHFMHVSTKPPTSAATTESIERYGAIPPLENGDRLRRDEFLRRYEAMPGLKKAELIDGVVHVPSPVPHRYHGRQHYHLLSWLGHYEAGTPGVEGGDNSTVWLDLDIVPQPDCLFFIRPEHGGKVKLDEQGYLVGAPELVAEVASSSASYDLHDKLEAYRRHGVREYLVWRVLDKQIDWFVLLDERYERLTAASDGTLRSTIFPGLWLDAAALLRGDLRAVLTCLQQGLDSPEHAHFVSFLQESRVEPPG